MKPIKLVIEGINSFTDPQTLDFEAAGRNNLFCICGKTGAGKSTIFDSLMLALYGRCGKGNLADVVNLSRMKARVILDFSSGADIYTVDRTITCKFEKDANGKTTDKRKAGTECMLYKNGAPIAKGKDEINPLIAAIIGLDAGEFKNVYLLEQGEYAAFLKMPPADQTEAVGKIFSLMRFAKIFKKAEEKRKAEEVEISALDRSIEAIGDASPDKLKEIKQAVAALKTKAAAGKKAEEAAKKQLDELDKIRDKYNDVRTKQQNVKNLMLQADEAKVKLYNAETALKAFEESVDKTLETQLSEVRQKLNELAALHARDEECKRAEEEARAKQAALFAAQNDETEALKALDILKEKVEGERRGLADGIAAFKAEAQKVKTPSDTLKRVTEGLLVDIGGADVASFARDISDEFEKYKALCESVAEKQGKFEKLKADYVKQLALIERYTKELGIIAEQKTAAQKTEAEALKALERAKLEFQAAAVAAELHAGEVCPVCGGTYDGKAHCAGGDVSEYKTAHEKAAEALKNITERETEGNRHLERAKIDFDHIEENKAQTEKELNELLKQKSASCVDETVYTELIRMLTEVRAASGKLAEADADVKKHEPALSALKAKREAAFSAAEESAKKAEAYKKELGDNYGKTQAAIAEAKKQNDELDRKYKAVEQDRKALTAASDGAKAASDAMQKSLELAKADCPVDLPEFDEENYLAKKDEFERLRIANGALDTEIAVKENDVKTLAEKCEKLASIHSDRANHVKTQALYRELADITRGKAMLNFVAAEYIDDFTAIASEVLGELSHGKYSMSYDKDNGFVVSDFLNDGKSRKTDTLSGGELFLASLSVAIAIARTQSKGNNAFFFLDEGFGTLDNELIDIVFGALESLSRDCLVGVISHSDALIEKMPSCVEVIEASDTKGSVIKY